MSRAKKLMGSIALLVVVTTLNTGCLPVFGGDVERTLSKNPAPPVSLQTDDVVEIVMSDSRWQLGSTNDVEWKTQQSKTYSGTLIARRSSRALDRYDQRLEQLGIITRREAESEPPPITNYLRQIVAIEPVVVVFVPEETLMVRRVSWEEVSPNVRRVRFFDGFSAGSLIYTTDEVRYWFSPDARAGSETAGIQEIEWDAAARLGTIRLGAGRLLRLERTDTGIWVRPAFESPDPR